MLNAIITKEKNTIKITAMSKDDNNNHKIEWTVDSNYNVDIDIMGFPISAHAENLCFLDKDMNSKARKQVYNAGYADFYSEYSGWLEECGEDYDTISGYNYKFDEDEQFKKITSESSYISYACEFFNIKDVGQKHIEYFGV